jgi:peptidoglycan/LPS O-acetylase OafA/YrhL
MVMVCVRDGVARSNPPIPANEANGLAVLVLSNGGSGSDPLPNAPLCLIGSDSRLQPQAKINTLQAGRGLAALAVVLHHSAQAAKAFGGPFTGFDALYKGYLGVDFFFVLSGFIIYHTTAGRPLTLQSYTRKRVKRVFLPYLPVGIGIALLYTFMPSISAGERDWSWLPTLTLLPVQANTALSVAWTLKHEMLFYGVFALFYFSRLLSLGLLAWAAVIVLLPSSLLIVAPINLEFLFGILAAIAFRRGWSSPWLLLPAAAALAAWFQLGKLPTASWLVGLAIAFSLPVVLGAERRGAFTVPRPLIALGDASYSLYLVHVVAIVIVARLVPGWLGILLAGVAASLVAGLSYHQLVEQRLLDLFKPQVDRATVLKLNARPQ